MSISFEDGEISGCKIIEPEIHSDERGSLRITYTKEVFNESGIGTEFIQDKISRSKYGVLRGFHYQMEGYSQAKLVRCTRGVILDVVVDLRRDSPTYGDYSKEIISEYNNRMLFLPKGIAHGFLVLSEEAEVHYKIDSSYRPDKEAGILWNDSTLDIKWPIDKPTVSDKDQEWPTFAEAEQRDLVFDG